MAGKKVAKPKKTIGTPKEIPTDYKMLQELKSMNDTLKEIRDILDNTWRERSPQ